MCCYENSAFILCFWLPRHCLNNDDTRTPKYFVVVFFLRQRKGCCRYMAREGGWWEQKQINSPHPCWARTLCLCCRASCWRLYLNLGRHCVWSRLLAKQFEDGAESGGKILIEPALREAATNVPEGKKEKPLGLWRVSAGCEESLAAVGVPSSEWVREWGSDLCALALKSGCGSAQARARPAAPGCSRHGAGWLHNRD